VPVASVLDQARERLAVGPRPAYVTVTGAGEPTLHSGLLEVVTELVRMSSAPVAVLTNGALLGEPAVREACRAADLVMPTISAADGDLFERIHRPISGLTVESVVAGLCAFRREYDRRLWVEVMLLDGINTGSEQIDSLRRLLEMVQPDRIQLNTVVRPPADASTRAVSREHLAQTAQRLGAKAEVVAGFCEHGTPSRAAAGLDEVLALLSRRPCRPADVADGLGIHLNEAVKLLARLQEEARVTTRYVENECFFQVGTSP
jgi:wyosine [tRNA(Phe)-imidazoG37] synthetase (radical SAM superfamily)